MRIGGSTEGKMTQGQMELGPHSFTQTPAATPTDSRSQVTRKSTSKKEGSE